MGKPSQESKATSTGATSQAPQDNCLRVRTKYDFELLGKCSRSYSDHFEIWAFRKRGRKKRGDTSLNRVGLRPNAPASRRSSGLASWILP